VAKNALTCNNSGRSRDGGRSFVASRPATTRDLTGKAGDWQPHHHNVTGLPTALTTMDSPRPLRRTCCVEIRVSGSSSRRGRAVAVIHSPSDPHGPAGGEAFGSKVGRHAHHETAHGGADVFATRGADHPTDAPE
jgi:hypothetical protein